MPKMLLAALLPCPSRPSLGQGAHATDAPCRLNVLQRSPRAILASDFHLDTVHGPAARRTLDVALIFPRSCFGCLLLHRSFPWGFLPCLCLCRWARHFGFSFLTTRICISCRAWLGSLQSAQRHNVSSLCRLYKNTDCRLLYLLWPRFPPMPTALAFLFV